MTILLVLAGWVVLSLPLGILFGALCGHQRRLETRPMGPAPRVPAPRVPAGSAA